VNTVPLAFGVNLVVADDISGALALDIEHQAVEAGVLACPDIGQVAVGRGRRRFSE
jgi:hypothetical protein